MTISTASVWERLEEELNKLSIKKYCEDYPESRFAIAIILSGGKERDYDYLDGDEFLYHCELAALNSDFVKLMIEKAIYYIDNKIPLAEKEVEEVLDEIDDHY